MNRVPQRSIWVTLLGVTLVVCFGVVFILLSALPSAMVSGVATVTINPSTTITVQNNVYFGAIRAGTSNDTTDNNPIPLLVRNDGNVPVDIEIRYNQSLFKSTQAGNNTETFQFKVGNCSVVTCGSPEIDAIDWQNSITTWVNFTDTDQKVIDSLNYNDTNDEVEIEIKIAVPLDELSGNRSAVVILTASQES